MKAIVVFESMFGSTHELANAIAEGLRRSCDVEVMRADDVDDAAVEKADLLVVGGPTHAHSLSTEASRHSAETMWITTDEGPRPEEPAMTEGLREWLEGLDAVPPRFAAFDTRSDMPRILTGAASKRIARELRKKGSDAIVPPESFLVERYAGLEDGELDRGREWGELLAEHLSDLRIDH
ncbi:MAG: flavodoxin domain-containing protein [Mycetocola sp.]